MHTPNPPLSLVTMLFLLSLGLVLGCPGDDSDDDTSEADDDAADDDSGDDDDVGDDDAADDDSGADDDDSAAGEPDLVVNPQVLDFGSVAVGSTLGLPLEIVNIGDGPLEIFDMVSPVTVITFTPFTGVLPPGAHEAVAFDATCTEVGEQTGHLVIQSSDPDEPQKLVPVTVMCVEA